MSEQPSGKAVASLVFSILGMLGFCCLGPLVGVILGWGERSGVGRAGFIVGWIGLILQLVVIVIWALAMALGFGASLLPLFLTGN